MTPAPTVKSALTQIMGQYEQIPTNISGIRSDQWRYEAENTALVFCFAWLVVGYHAAVQKKKKEKKIGLHSPISRNTAIAILRMGTCGLLSTSKNALLKSGAKRPGKWFMLGSFIVVE